MHKLPTLLAAMLLTAGAQASDIPAFEKLDVDQDGQISVTEAAVDEKLAAAFDKIDTNADGAISLDEFNTAMGG